MSRMDGRLIRSFFAAVVIAAGFGTPMVALGVVAGTPAGAQGVDTTIDTTDIVVADIRVDFSGYPAGSSDFGAVSACSCCGGAGAKACA